ncbi:MAG: DeoR/GlpR family DNA-binding transcription regulator [Methylacidiphilales bacterium]|nr:DeoR/GlpR family DNA-binding transcription regulator [Candidatus Methylacidiphilales bacterium]
MRVSRHLVEARRERLVTMIAQYGYLPVQELCRRLGISEATARRDLSGLEKEKKVRRTYGGAISEYDSRFPSFSERRDQSKSAKRKIAKASLSYILPGSTCFFDAGTTIYAIAEAFREHPIVPLKIVTSNIPIGELLAGIPGVEVFLVAGRLLSRQSVLLGEIARKSLKFWRFDSAFLSAEAMNPNGIWNSQAAIVEQQQAVIRRTRLAIFCLDGRKLRRNAPHFLLPWNKVDVLLTEVPRRELLQAGIRIVEARYSSALDKRKAANRQPPAKR